MSLAAVVRSEAKLLLPTYDRQRVCLSAGAASIYGIRRATVSRLPERDRVQRARPRASRHSVHVEAAGWPPDSRLESVFPRFQAELAKRLTRISGLDKAFFCNSGTEAWEGALKMARAFARTQNNNGHKASGVCWRWRILFTAVLSARWRQQDRKSIGILFAPLVPGVGFVGFNDVERSHAPI